MRLTILVKLRVVVKNKYVHLLTWKDFQYIYISLEKKIAKQHVWNEPILIKINHMCICLFTYVYIFKNTRLNTKMILVFKSK